MVGGARSIVDYELHKRNGQGQLGNEASDAMRPIDHGLGFILTLCGSWWGVHLLMSERGDERNNLLFVLSYKHRTCMREGSQNLRILHVRRSLARTNANIRLG